MADLYEDQVPRPKWDAEVTVRLIITVYAEDKDEARLAAHRVALGLVKRTGAGDGTVIGLQVQRKGSGRDEYLPRKQLRDKR